MRTEKKPTISPLYIFNQQFSTSYHQIFPHNQRRRYTFHYIFMLAYIAGKMHSVPIYRGAIHLSTLHFGPVLSCKLLIWSIIIGEALAPIWLGSCRKSVLLIVWLNCSTCQHTNYPPISTHNLSTMHFQLSIISWWVFGWNREQSDWWTWIFDDWGNSKRNCSFSCSGGDCLWISYVIVVLKTGCYLQYLFSYGWLWLCCIIFNALAFWCLWRFGAFDVWCFWRF